MKVKDLIIFFTETVKTAVPSRAVKKEKGCYVRDVCTYSHTTAGCGLSTCSVSLSQRRAYVSDPASKGVGSIETFLFTVGNL